MKIARHGLIIGKFMPLTTGHCHLIDAALAQVEQLTILVCSLKDEPIDGHLRRLWVSETFPQARVVHLTAELPSYPHEHPQFWGLWKAAIERAVPPVDAVFSSEDYGPRLAGELGARHVAVDPARRAVPISATRVRQNPLACWNYLPPAVRPFFVQRVLLFGPESTGKSTLARQLAAHFESQFVPEYARGLLEPKGGICTYEDIPAIAIGQMDSEEAAARQANRVLFCDTDLVTTTIYSRHYFGRCPHFIQKIANERRYDLYLFTDIDLPWEADPQRDLGHRRAEFRALFQDELISRRLPFTLIQGQGAARTQTAVDAVQSLLDRRLRDGRLCDH